MPPPTAPGSCSSPTISDRPAASPTTSCSCKGRVTEHGSAATFFDRPRPGPRAPTSPAASSSETMRNRENVGMYIRTL